MADPVTLTAISVGTTMAAGATGAAGSIFGGLSKGAMSDYEANVAKMNAMIARQNAANDMAAGETQQVQMGMKDRAQISQTAATQGASGLDMRSGTAVAVRASEQEMARINQGNILYGARLRAYGDMVQAAEQDAQASIKTMEAGMYRTAGYIGAASSILGATGQSFSTLSGAQQRGIDTGAVLDKLNPVSMLG